MLDVRSASRTAGPVGEPAEGLSPAARKGVLGIVLGYAFFATLWILLSDRLAGLLFTSRSTLILISSVKGLAFVVITSILLLLTLNRYARGLVAREAGTRREEREKLHALRMLGALSEASPDPIYVKDEDGRYLLFNQAAGRAVGKDPREVVGQGDRALFPPDEAEALIAADREIMAQGVSITMEEELSTTAGRITFLATKGPIRDAEGRVCGLFGVARDITQRKQVEENLRASERKFSTVFHLSPDAIDLTLL